MARSKQSKIKEDKISTNSMVIETVEPIIKENFVVNDNVLDLVMAKPKDFGLGDEENIPPIPEEKIDELMEKLQTNKDDSFVKKSILPGGRVYVTIDESLKKEKNKTINFECDGNSIITVKTKSPDYENWVLQFEGKHPIQLSYNKQIKINKDEKYTITAGTGQLVLIYFYV